MQASGSEVEAIWVDGLTSGSPVACTKTCADETKPAEPLNVLNFRKQETQDILRTKKGEKRTKVAVVP